MAPFPKLSFTRDGTTVTASEGFSAVWRERWGIENRNGLLGFVQTPVLHNTKFHYLKRQMRRSSDMLQDRG